MLNQGYGRPSRGKSVSGGTYGVDGGQGQGEVEVVAVVDVSVPHEPQVFIPHHLDGAETEGDVSLTRNSYIQISGSDNKWIRH